MSQKPPAVHLEHNYESDRDTYVVVAVPVGGATFNVARLFRGLPLPRVEMLLAPLEKDVHGFTLDDVTDYVSKIHHSLWSTP